MVSDMNDVFWIQAAILFWGALCFFRAGAAALGVRMTLHAWWEIVQTAAIVVLVFAFLSGGRGVDATGPTARSDSGSGSSLSS